MEQQQYLGGVAALAAAIAAVISEREPVGVARVVEDRCCCCGEAD
jgi:hypothetical protein